MQPKTPLPELGQNLVAYLPSRPVYLGKSFDINIYANFQYLLETFVIDFAVGPSLRMKSFALNSAGGWSGTTASTGRAATLSYLRDTSSLSTARGQPAQLLAVMTLEVRAGALPGHGSVSMRSNNQSRVILSVRARCFCVGALDFMHMFMTGSLSSSTIRVTL